ncbi:hypothetical protein ACQPXM_06545 [Kribbella sp. CA-253562]|uniref:hypothetical protein n=1 Tax=Kribbella sp. CA-253562 TaxID=3239942 RepID=UPI003D8EFE79
MARDYVSGDLQQNPTWTAALKAFVENLSALPARDRLVARSLFSAEEIAGFVTASRLAARSVALDQLLADARREDLQSDLQRARLFAEGTRAALEDLHLPSEGLQKARTNARLAISASVLRLVAPDFAVARVRRNLIEVTRGLGLASLEILARPLGHDARPYANGLANTDLTRSLETLKADGLKYPAPDVRVVVLGEGTDLHNLIAIIHRLDQTLTDAENADLTNLDLRSVPLGGVRWSTQTQWPTKWHARIRASSREVAPGVFEVESDFDAAEDALP